MSSPNPQVGDHMNKWGYSFVWTDEHLPREETDPLQYESDRLGDEALAKLLEIEAVKHKTKKDAGAQAPRDLYALLRDHREEDEVLRELWDEAHVVPSWVSWDQIERGQKYFSRYAIANLVGFGLQGFVAENATAVRVVEVLVRTGGFPTSKLLGRLLETFQWLVQVTDYLASIQPGASAHIATVHFRLLHASVRHKVRKLASRYPGYFDEGNYGVPVNTLDSIHSISTFSCNQLYLQLPRFGIVPSQQEQEDYIAVLRCVLPSWNTPSLF
ncbi:transcriptional regulator [Penicillium malachiteum]|uniref:Transcriptional regulator n=1 Tax=Penicillium malachiteum TaxID=1324776 RepID=A0AAD6MVM4_9EURO|nr:transcriptional regulator [Penicillium malachiteum]